ncbi:hypothetical protein YB2330_003810 [Saitoella coloradoensis]
MGFEAAVLCGKKDIRMETRHLEDPGLDEVQVAPKATGICGSDLHYYAHGANGLFVVKEPLILGHESAGVVTAIGADVTNFKVGDRVALEAGMPCSTCKMCRMGRYNLCDGMQFRSSAKRFPHCDGYLCERVNQHIDFTHKLPHSISYQEGALLEPLSVALHAIRRSQPSLTPGSRILIMGSGTVGLLVAAMARINGASDITIADISQRRLEFAQTTGWVTRTVLVPLKDARYGADPELVYAKDTASRLIEVAKMDQETYSGFDVTYECTGVDTSIQTSIFTTRPGGKLVMVGMGKPIATLPIASAMTREIDLVGVFRYCNTYPEAIRIVASGGIPGLEKLVTQRYPLEDAREAFEVAERGEDEEGRLVVKVVIGADKDRLY